ncbi:MAG: STAS domain-containing protein [Spirochaetes bacterium]|nr:STAS domain-containing protein [Spirochaetota bacterium]
MNDRIKLAKRTIKGYDIIDIIGDISSEGSKEIVKYMKKAITGKDKDVYVNLEGVRHMNSSALSVIVQMVRDLATKKINIFFMNVNEKIMTLIKVAGLHNFFKFMADEAALLDKIEKMDKEANNA